MRLGKVGLSVLAFDTKIGVTMLGDQQVSELKDVVAGGAVIIVVVEPEVGDGLS